VQWVAIGAWIGALAFAVVILGFCAYEVYWKARRLRGDLAAFIEVGARAQQLRADAVGVQQRLARTTSG
jgi:hypothetical protein